MLVTLVPVMSGTRNTASARQVVLHQQKWMKVVRNLAKSPSEYLLSSALFNQQGKHSIYELNNYKELEDINLTEG